MIENVRTCVAAVVTCGFVFASLGATTGRDAQAKLPSTRRVVELASDYVRRYQDRFQFLVADETSEQRLALKARPDDPTERRRTTGEMFVTYLHNERQWTAVHDVAAVDGIPVVDREDLTALAQKEAFASVARRIFSLNARYNIGPVVRNFNDPMLALLVLGAERQARFSFSREPLDAPSTERQLVRLTFKERERPTLIRDSGGRPVYARGELIVDALTGAVRRTRIGFSHDGVDAELTTEFSFEDRLELWVPSGFQERYASNREGRALITTCESEYTNYRRFEVTGRVR